MKGKNESSDVVNTLKNMLKEILANSQTASDERDTLSAHVKSQAVTLEETRVALEKTEFVLKSKSELIEEQRGLLTRLEARLAEQGELLTTQGLALAESRALLTEREEKLAAQQEKIEVLETWKTEQEAIKDKGKERAGDERLEHGQFFQAGSAPTLPSLLPDGKQTDLRLTPWARDIAECRREIAEDRIKEAAVRASNHSGGAP